MDKTILSAIIILITIILLKLIYKISLYLFLSIYIKKRIKMEQSYDDMLERNKIAQHSEKKEIEIEQVKEINSAKKHILVFLASFEKYMMIKTGYIPCHFLRKFLYKKVFKLNVNSYSIINYGCEFRRCEKINIGQGTIMGDKCIIDGRKGVNIGKNVNFGTSANVWSMQHEVQSTDFAVKGGKVEIGDRAWISNNVIVLPNVKIGEGAVIAAGAVLTKDAEPYGVYAGIPAKKVGERNKNLTYTQVTEKHLML